MVIGDRRLTFEDTMFLEAEKRAPEVAHLVFDENHVRDQHNKTGGCLQYQANF